MRIGLPNRCSTSRFVMLVWISHRFGDADAIAELWTESTLALLEANHHPPLRTATSITDTKTIAARHNANSRLMRM